MNISVSAFFPAFNDAASLPGLIDRTFRVLAEHVAGYEVIVVNDGSCDNTAAVLKSLQRNHGPRLRIVTHARNQGYGAALRSGFRAASKEFVFYTDADGQYDVGELPLLLERLRPDIGLVNGYKLERHDPWHRIWIGKAYNSLARLIFRVRLRDIDCDYRLIRRTLVQDLKLRSTSGAVCVELVRKIELSGCGVAEVGVHHYPRLHGRSQFFRLRSLACTFRQLVSLYFGLVARPWLARALPSGLLKGHSSNA